MDMMLWAAFKQGLFICTHSPPICAIPSLFRNNVNSSLCTKQDKEEARKEKAEGMM
jgi:hypothetical protein